MFSFSFFGISGWGIDLDYCDIEWFALETNRDYSVVFEITSKYYISDSFAGKDWGQEEKGMTEDEMAEMAGWHH